MSSLDDPHMEHTRHALWGHLIDEGEGGCLRRRVEETEVPRQASLMLTMPVLSRHPVRVWVMMACRYLRDGARADALERLGIIELCHNDLKVEGQTKFKCELEVRQLDDLKEEPPWVSSQESSNCISETREDAAPFRFFEVGMMVFLPRGFDMVYLQEEKIKGGVRRQCVVDGSDSGASAMATGVDLDASRIQPTPLFLGRIGADDRVALPCPTSFTSPMPVYMYARPCYVDSFNHECWARACRTPVLISQFLPRLIDIRVSHTRDDLAGCPWPCRMAVATYRIPCWGKILLYFHMVV
ncbi:hypothetical protein GOBAR_AA16144 [Gossypium barbadense]|uniref:Uncharacterized protein n=1 Tax=Gossypium barbadense TaxID=3634 RepID=A0A2P5XMG2_GOSBA|nr:hypothetical protein GOBAR_AA16144 [Gossypium barbadense]